MIDRDQRHTIPTRDIAHLVIGHADKWPDALHANSR